MVSWLHCFFAVVRYHISADGPGEAKLLAAQYLKSIGGRGRN